MAKMKQLSQAIIGPSRSGKWEEVEQMIEQMTPEDFAVTYESSHTIPLLQVFGWGAPFHITESIIKKNPVFAAKVVDEYDRSVLHYVCMKQTEENALKIVNLLLPYMSQETIVGGLEPNVPYHTFLHRAAGFGKGYENAPKYYKVAGAVSSELISIMLKNSGASTNTVSYVSLVQFLKEAVHFYDSQITQHPEIADNYFRKGVILQGMGKLEKAIKCYQKAIGLDPTYADKIEGIELSTLAAPTVVVTAAAADDREAMKAKITELTEQLSKLMQTTTALAEEVTFLRGSFKVVEEHKGQMPGEPPSYEEDVAVEAPALPASLPPVGLLEDIGLTGDTVIDGTVVYHA